MNLQQLCTAVGQRLGIDTTAGTRDGNAIRSFAQLRHDQLYRSFLWKDSIIEMELNINPTATYLPNNNYMPTKGRVILPPIFGHVLGVNFGCRSLNVQRQMLYYRANYNQFFKDGTVCEFYLLSSCVWETDEVLETVLSITNQADTTFPATVDYLGSDEVSVLRSVLNPVWGAQFSNSIVIANTDRVDNLTKTVTQGQYQLQIFNFGLQIKNNFNAPLQLTITDFTIPTAPVNTTFTLQPNQTSQFYPGQFGEIQYNDGSTSGTLSSAAGGLNGLQTYIGNGVFAYTPLPYLITTLQPAEISAAKCQRIQLVGKPSTTIQQNNNLHVLGKRTTPPFSAETDVPGVNGLDGILFALLYYDMAQRDERGGTPDAVAALQEAVGPQFLANGKPGGFLGKLIEEEVVQEATNTRIIPEQGFGGSTYFDEPFGSKADVYWT